MAIERKITYIDDYKNRTSSKDLSQYKNYDVGMHIEEMTDEEASEFVNSLQKAKGLNIIW